MALRTALGHLLVVRRRRVHEHLARRVAEDLIGVPVLDDEEPAGTQPREHALERCARRTVLVAAVVEHEVDGLAVEARVEDTAEVGGVGLVHAVVGVHGVGETTPFDELGQRGEGRGLEVDRDQVARVRDEGDQGGAAAFGDAELDDVAAGEALAELAVALHQRQGLDDEEALGGRAGHVLADELDAVDREAVTGQDPVDRARRRRRRGAASGCRDRARPSRRGYRSRARAPGRPTAASGDVDRVAVRLDELDERRADALESRRDRRIDLGRHLRRGEPGGEPAEHGAAVARDLEARDRPRPARIVDAAAGDVGLREVVGHPADVHEVPVLEVLEPVAVVLEEDVQDLAGVVEEVPPAGVLQDLPGGVGDVRDRPTGSPPPSGPPCPRSRARRYIEKCGLPNRKPSGA